MYFLTDEERQRLLKGILPKSRSAEVAPELRGWNWNQPPLEPIYDVTLAVYEVAGKYCSTSRDVYLRRVQKVKAAPNADMIMGTVFHEVVAELFVRAKRLVYSYGVQHYRQVLNELEDKSIIEGILQRHEERLPSPEAQQLCKWAEVVWQFEVSRLSTRIQETIAKQPYIREDSLVAMAIPVMVEQRLNGSFLGLSQMLSTDAFIMPEPMVMDLKFGEQRKFHRLATTGYALVMESIYEYPVNIGCVVYLRFHDDRMVVTKDIHIIDDELRQWFIEERDQRARMIYEEMDPGLSEECYETCPYRGECRE